MTYNPLGPEETRNPYPIYARMRREAPLERSSLGFWAASRYEDVDAALRDPRRFSSAVLGDMIQTMKSHSPEALGAGETLIGTDPPAHSRLRKIVNRAFTPRRIEALEPRIRVLARELLAAPPRTGEVELMGALAVPLPVMVIAEILGIDVARRADFKRWSEEILAAIAGSPSIELRERLERSFLERAAYLEEVIESRKRQPRDDVITDLVRAQAGEEVMTEDEVANFIVLLLVAGNETTTNLIGNAILALLEHPRVLEAVRAAPSRIPALVEETLRYDSPVQLTLRRATCDVELAGVRVREGEVVALLLGSANRDEREFAKPDRFDPGRGAAHLAFGYGTHFCLGAHLARLEARIALETLFDRFRSLELAGSVERIPSLLTRGPRSLPLHVA